MYFLNAGKGCCARFVTRVVFAAVVLVAMPVAASAQIEVGLRSGLNFAKWGGDDINDPSFRTDANFGAFVTFPVSRVFGVQIGAGYSSKGVVATGDGPNTSLSAGYVEFPVLAMFSVPTFGDFGVHFLAGPAISFRTGCTLGFVAIEGDLEDDCDAPGVPDPLDLNTTDFGAMFGAGVDITVADRTTLLVDVMYNLGLTKLVDSDVDSDFKNRVISIDVGLAYRLGR